LAIALAVHFISGIAKIWSIAAHVAAVHMSIEATPITSAMEISMSMIGTNASGWPDAARPRSLPRLSFNLSATIRIWIARSHQRQALAELNDHLLRDIGVTRHEALREAAKPFWRR
jgi:uncharacterized protein YjiS (DUF1127 family)